MPVNSFANVLRAIVFVICALSAIGLVVAAMTSTNDISTTAAGVWTFVAIWVARWCNDAIERRYDDEDVA